MKHAQRTILDLEKRLEELNKESHKIKSAINCLYEVMGEPPKYELGEEARQVNTQTRKDEYYGRPLATVITEVLEKRKIAGYGAATLDEIYNELRAGGYKFTGKNEGIQKRGLSISMSKNQKFHKLPNDTWGLAEWYPSAKETKKEQEEQIIDEITSQEENTPF